MRILLAIILAFTLGLSTVSADNWWDNPPPPPNAGNTDYWPLDTYEFAPEVIDYSTYDSDPSIQEVNDAAFLSKIDQEPYWLYT